MEIEKMKKELKSRLTEKRYNHSLGTMKEAIKLAKIYGENEEEAAFAGLMHDIAKELSKEEIENYLQKYNIKPDEIEQKQPALLHAKLGAAIVKEEFGANEKIQQAIKYHTTGNVAMNMFDKIIYTADKIEENRVYEGIEILRDNANSGLIDKAIILNIDYTLQEAIDKSRLIHPDTIDLRNKLLSEIS